MKQLLLATAILLHILTPNVVAADDDLDLRLYRLDCGRVHVNPLNVFSDVDAYPDREIDLVDSCYLIKHGSDWMMWDTGLSAGLAEQMDGQQNGPFHLWVDQTIPNQLSKLGLVPEDINYVGISHGHFDHIGNTNLFQNAELIIQAEEYELFSNPENAELIIQAEEYELFSNPEKARAFHMEPDLISFFLQGEGRKQVRQLKGDADIFGDGTVSAISLNGHTPGHMALQIELPQTGTVYLSGDQWHFKENHEKNGVPVFNYDRADTLASSDRLNGLMKNKNAKLIIQHDQIDNEMLPRIPAYLE